MTTRKRVLVAVDENEASMRAADFANDFFDDAEIFAVSVASVPLPWAPTVGFGAVFAGGGVDPAVGPRELDRAREASERTAASAIEKSDIDSDRELIRGGDPVDAISTAALEFDVDLIVVGAKDKGFLERLLRGSVSQELAREAPRPVLVVH